MMGSKKIILGLNQKNESGFTRLKKYFVVEHEILGKKFQLKIFKIQPEN